MMLKTCQKKKTYWTSIERFICDLYRKMKIRWTHHKKNNEYHNSKCTAQINFCFFAFIVRLYSENERDKLFMMNLFFTIVSHTKCSSHETKSTQRWYDSQLKKKQDQHHRSKDVQNLHASSCGNAPECDNRLNMYRFNMLCLHVSSVSSISERPF